MALSERHLHEFRYKRILQLVLCVSIDVQLRAPLSRVRMHLRWFSKLPNQLPVREYPI